MRPYVIEGITMKHCEFSFAAMTLLVASLLTGCAQEPERPPTFPVSGVVTSNGKPVDRATVVFVASSPGVESAVGITNAEGKYQLTTYSQGDGAQAGEYRIKVSKYDMKAPTADEKQQYMTQEQEQKIYFEDERPTPPSKNLLPKKYENESTSGLTHTVKDAPSTLDIDIK